MNTVQYTEEMRFRSGAALVNDHFIKLGFLPSIVDELVTALNAAAHESDGLRLSIPIAYIQARA